MSSPTMFRNVVLLGLIGVIMYTSVSLASAKPMSCKKLITSMGKKIFKILGNCSRELKESYPKKEDMAERFQCILKCAMLSLGMLSSEGKLTNATLKAFMDNSVPEAFHEVGFTITTHCIKDFGEKLDMKDEYCTSYGEMVKCLQDSVADYTELCNHSDVEI